MYSVYIHVLPNNKKYVGTTKQEPKLRWQSGLGYRKNKEFSKDIKKYKWENIKHLIIGYFDNCEDAYLLEQELIRKYKTTNKEYGYNKSMGGRYSRQGIKNIHYNIKENNPARRKVLCVELNKMFETITEAYETLNIDISAIVKCCKGKRYTAGGYHWTYI